MTNREIIKLLILFTTLPLGIAPLAIIAQSSPPDYDPDLYYTHEALVRVSSGKSGIGTTLSVVNGKMSRAVESGSWHYPWGHHSHYRNPSAIATQQCGGGDDTWVYFNFIPENELWGKDLRVGSWNGVSDAYIRHISNGLDGGYVCAGGLCNISVCASENINGWQVKLSWN